MPLASSNGPRWIRTQNVAAGKRIRGIAPIRRFLQALLYGRLGAGAEERGGSELSEPKT
jgi:hypothetical protein